VGIASFRNSVAVAGCSGLFEELDRLLRWTTTNSNGLVPVLGVTCDINPCNSFLQFIGQWLHKWRNFKSNLQIKQDFLPVEGRPPANRTHRLDFFSSDLDLDLDPMTLIYELDLDIRKILYTKNEVSSQGFQKIEPKQDRQTDTGGRTYYHAALKKEDFAWTARSVSWELIPFIAL